MSDHNISRRIAICVGMHPQRASVIDLGSNTVKLVIYTVSAEHEFRPYLEESVMTRLGTDLLQTGFLGTVAMEKAVSALRRFKEILGLESVTRVMPVATSAVREAANGREFLRRIQRETGFEFAILPAREEALYSYVGAARSLRVPSMIFFDLGGGSVEIVHAQEYSIRRVMSLPLGSLRLTQMHADAPDGSYTLKGATDLKNHVLGLIPRREELQLADGTEMVGSGGTVRNLAKIHQLETGYPVAKIHNYSMSGRDVSEISSRLMLAGPEVISEMGPVSAGRATTMAAGAIVVNLLMENLGFPQITVSAQALREGLFSELLGSGDESKRISMTGTRAEESVRSWTSQDSLPPFMEDLAGSLTKLDSTVPCVIPALSYAFKVIPEVSALRDPESIFHVAIGRDSHLDHATQIVAALSAVSIRKKRSADRMLEDYAGVLGSTGRRAMRQTASLLTLGNLLARMDASVSTSPSPDGISLTIGADDEPHTLLADAMKRLSTAFEIQIRCTVNGRTV